MRIRDLFVLAIKLMAFSLLIDLAFTSFPTSLFYLVNNQYLSGFEGMALVSVLCSFAVLLLVLVFAGKIVDLLQVERGFSNPIISIGTLSLVQIAYFAVFCIGLLLIVQNLPLFLRDIWMWFKENAVENTQQFSQISENWWLGPFQVFLGYMMLQYAGEFAQILIKEQKKME